jgi:hypothetical protein
MEYLGERFSDAKIQLFGTDVSVDALQTARAGRYIENIARNVSPARLERFFTRDGDHYCVNKSVRSLCTFARHNVATDPPFSRIDLINCRNLMIYLDPMLQRTVLPLFHYALASDGVLMLGPSESVGASSELFSVISSVSSKLYSKKLRPGRRSAHFRRQCPRCEDAFADGKVRGRHHSSYSSDGPAPCRRRLLFGETYELHPDVPFEGQSDTACCHAGVLAASQGDPRAGAEARRRATLVAVRSGPRGA